MRCMAVTSTALHNSHIHHHSVDGSTPQHPHSRHIWRTVGTISVLSHKKTITDNTWETTIKTWSKTIKNDRSIVFQHKRYKSHQEQSKTRTHHNHRHRTSQTNTISAYCAKPLVKPFECYHSLNIPKTSFSQSELSVLNRSWSQINLHSSVQWFTPSEKIRIIGTNISKELSRSKCNTKNKFFTNMQVKQFTTKARPVQFN